MIRVFRRIDNVPERSTGEQLNGGPHLVAHRGEPGVHEEKSFAAGEHGDVATSPDEHQGFAVYREELNLTGCGLAQLRRPDGLTDALLPDLRVDPLGRTEESETSKERCPHQRQRWDD